MKTFVLPTFIFTCWGLALLGLQLPQLSKAYRSHHVLTTAYVSFILPGLEARLANDLMIEKSPLLEKTRELGYQIRLALNLIPDWLLLVPDPFQPNFNQLVVREEVADEFTNPEMEKRMIALTAKLNESRASFEKATHSRTFIFMEPTKIAANQLKVEWAQVSPMDLEKFNSSDGARYVGAFTKQSVMENNLNAEGFTAISPVAFYRDEQSRSTILYPRGESHWNGQLEIRSAQLVIETLVAHEILPEACFLKSKTKIFATQKMIYFGDLFQGLGWDETFPASHVFETEIQEYHVPPPVGTTQIGCPKLVLAGSSYGVANWSGADFSDYLQAYYLGTVENKSMAGKDGLFVLRSLADHPPFPDSVVIWEFPFRYVKRAL